MSVRFTADGPVATITLDRPEARNAIDAATGEALREAMDRLETDPALRVGILAATGPVFCAGMDLRAFQDGEAEPILFGEHRLGGLVSRARTKPLIAAIQGPALAGGFELVLACDITIAAPTARFGLPEPGLGLVAGAGGAMRLARRIPRAVAAKWLLTGDAMPAAEAAALGLITETAEDPLARAQELAARIARNAPGSLRATLVLMDAALNEPAAWEANDAQLRALIEAPDAREGARAFTEKRPPVWSDT